MAGRPRPLVKWHGGKYYLAKWIISHFPETMPGTYGEPYFGMGSVFMNMDPATVEVIGDTNKRVINLFAVIRDHYEEFERVLRATPYSEAEFEEAVSTLLYDADGKPIGHTEEIEPIEAARRDYVIWRQSRGGRGDSWSETLHRVRREMADNVSAWLSSIDTNLPNVAARIQNAEIVDRPALETIKKWDSVDTLWYLDPTYPPETRANPNVYDKEMTLDDHADLLDLVLNCSGKFIISSYPNDLYAEYLKDWRRVDRDMPNQAAGGAAKNRVTESLYLNY